MSLYLQVGIFKFPSLGITEEVFKSVTRYSCHSILLVYKKHGRQATPKLVLKEAIAALQGNGEGGSQPVLLRAGYEKEEPSAK